MKYDAFETTFRANHMGGLETSLHYTLSKGTAQQGGSLVGNFNSSLGDAYFQTQDFFDPDVDMAPLSDEARHRVIGSAIYQFPWLADRRDLVGTVLGGWQLSGVISIRSGEPMRINPAVRHRQQPARLQRREPGIRRLARYAAVPRPQRVQLVPTSPRTTQRCGPAHKTPPSWKRQDADVWT